MRHYPPKITLTLVTAAFLLTVQAYLPGWRRYRFFDQSSVLRAFVPSRAANPASCSDCAPGRNFGQTFCPTEYPTS